MQADLRRLPFPPPLGTGPLNCHATPLAITRGIDVLALDKRVATTQCRPRHVRNIYEEKHTVWGGEWCVQTLLFVQSLDPCERCGHGVQSLLRKATF